MPLAWLLTRKRFSWIYGNLFLLKKYLFFISIYAYNINVGNRMLPEKAKDCRREEGGHAGDPLSFFLFSKLSKFKFKHIEKSFKLSQNEIIIVIEDEMLKVSFLLLFLFSCNHKYFHAGMYHSSIDSLNLIYKKCKKKKCKDDNYYLYGKLMEVGSADSYSRFSIEEQKILKKEFKKDIFMVFEFGSDNLKVFCHPKDSHLKEYKKDPENTFLPRTHYDIDARFIKTFPIDYKKVFIFRNCSLRERTEKLKTDMD